MAIRPKSKRKKGKRKKKSKKSKKSLSKGNPVVNHPLDYIFNRVEQNALTPYHLQSDPRMYTKENLEKRRSLKFDKDLKKSIKEFGDIYERNEEGNIDQKEYVRVHMKITKILHGNDSIIQDEQLQEMAKEDWKKDAKGGPFMDNEMLFDALFELVDIWCRTCSSKEYIMFLDSLKLKVKHPGAYDPNAYSVLF